MFLSGVAIRTLSLFFFLLRQPLSDVWWLPTNRHRLPTNRHRLPTNRLHTNRLHSEFFFLFIMATPGFYGGHSTGYKLGNHPKNIEPCAHRARTVRAPCDNAPFGSPNSKGVSKGCASGLFGGNIVQK